MNNRERVMRGLTMVELLVAVAVVGILAAIAVWNYLVGLERAKQKKSMADIRSIAGAWEARGTEIGRYNAAASVTWPENAVTYEELSGNLSPTYMRAIPSIDGWGNPFEFAMDRAFSDRDSASVYFVRSAGRDGEFEATYETTETESFDCDIVYSNGTFVVRPFTKQ